MIEEGAEDGVVHADGHQDRVVWFSFSEVDRRLAASPIPEWRQEQLDRLAIHHKPRATSTKRMPPGL